MGVILIVTVLTFEKSIKKKKKKFLTALRLEDVVENIFKFEIRNKARKLCINFLKKVKSSTSPD